jgi:hypothetical protein
MISRLAGSDRDRDRSLLTDIRSFERNLTSRKPAQFQVNPLEYLIRVPFLYSFLIESIAFQTRCSLPELATIYDYMRANANLFVRATSCISD